MQVEALKLNSDSIFLEIGSGFGYPNFYATGLTNCRGVGIDISESRIAFSNNIKDSLLSNDYYDETKWDALLQFVIEDVSKNLQPFTNSENKHCTHILWQNSEYLHDQAFMQSVTKRLNLTKFNILACNLKPNQSTKLGLKAQYISKYDRPETIEELKKTVYFYIKDNEIDSSCNIENESSEKAPTSNIVLPENDVPNEVNHDILSSNENEDNCSYDNLNEFDDDIKVYENLDEVTIQRTIYEKPSDIVHIQLLSKLR